MVIATKKDTSADPKKSATDIKTDEVVKAPQFSLELSHIGRYMYGGHLYLRNEVYVFDEAGARHMLQLRGPNGLAVFMVARKRTRMVQVEVETGTPVATPLTKQERRMADAFDMIKDGVRVTNMSPVPVPQQRIDLSDDSDLELQAHLARADALVDGPTGAELDTAVQI